MRITEKGQITIPQEIREKTRGKKLIEQMQNKATIRISTEQIMQLTKGGINDRNNPKLCIRVDVLN